MLLLYPTYSWAKNSGSLADVALSLDEYRRSPISAVFGFFGHRTNWGTALNGDKFNTKTRETGNFPFQSPLFLSSSLIGDLNSMESSLNYGYQKDMECLLTSYYQF